MSRTVGSFFLHDLPVRLVASDPNDAGIGSVPGGYISAAGANQDSTLVKNSAATVLALAAQNNHATLVRYLKLYNKGSAPTSADTPVARYALAPAGGGIARQQLMESFPLGLAFRITTGAADNDTGAASAGDVFVNVDYI